MLFISAPFGNYLTHKNATSVIGTFTLNKRSGLLMQMIKTLRSFDFKDKNVLLVDDSIVRGTTITQIIQQARQAGARKVCIASAAPAVRYQNV